MEDVREEVRTKIYMKSLNCSSSFGLSTRKIYNSELLCRFKLNK
jgi:hypothetical protein